MRRITSLINGQATTGSSELIDIINPHNEQTIGTLYEADASEVAQAVTAAREAFDHGPWPRLPVSERQHILRNIGRVLEDNFDELARLECEDTGIPLRDIRHRHLPRMRQNFDYVAALIALDSGSVNEQIDPYLTIISHEPAGVAALLAPWNAPLALASMKLAQAIASGNTAVLKPSEYTPSSLYRFVQLLHEAGLPDGVVNLVNGRGDVTGAALVGSPEIDRIAFTGGTHTGRSIMRAASDNLTPVMLELGGKSANIIFESADIDRAIDGALIGIFSNNGQQCLAGSRILLQRSIAEEFIKKFKRRAQAIRVGDPTDPATEIGPLCYREHFERVRQYQVIADSDGDQPICGGGDEHHEPGYYFPPTAYRVSSDQSRIWREEIFGPFASLLEFDSVDEAIRLANDSPYGLVAYAWTNDLTTALRVRDEVRAGTIWINSPLMRDLHAPFGGFKQSGVGRTGGFEGLHFFTETKSSCFAKQPVPLNKLGEKS